MKLYLNCKQAFSKEPNTEVVAKHLTYQQGDASVLQKAILGYETKPGTRSYEMGTIVQNVATVNAIANAVFEGEPLIARVTTLNGEIGEPKNLLVKIGTPISDILSANKIDAKDIYSVVVGGVMMGDCTSNNRSTINQENLKHNRLCQEQAQERSRANCLHPLLTMHSSVSNETATSIDIRAIMKGDIAKAEKLFAKDCIKCGTCSYVCPARLPLSSTVKSIS